MSFKNYQIAFDRMLSVLIYAAFASKPFTVSDVVSYVIDENKSVAYQCMKQLVDAGYLEKVTIRNYQATQKTKELFGGAK
ncbi:hypothetical protein [Acinetobacter junii]|uniref:hypothetical protein n=1 Tax=Acinetobacter junii TaxID=40215 RepID=UPI00124E865C|nr:hypothetical protein [Acinetobacter junii]